MAQFEVPVVRVDRIEDHPNADALEIAVVRGYRCVVKIGAHRAGDLVAYIPEDAIVPEPLIREMKLWDESKDKGMLAGKRGDRVKAIRLRGVVSQGLLHPVEGHTEGENLAARLDIVKYEPPIPIHMQGEVCNLRGRTLKYDIESIQKFPEVLREGEEVVFTEKIHGTWTCFGFWPGLDHPELLEGGTIINSKGCERHGPRLQVERGEPEQPLCPELPGGHAGNRLLGPRPGGRASAPGNRSSSWERPSGRRCRTFSTVSRDAPSAPSMCMWASPAGAGISTTTSCWRGRSASGASTSFPASTGGRSRWRPPERHRDGKTTFRGRHVREGIVISPVKERECPDLPGNRVKLKFVSPKYLLRRGKVTAFN